MAERNDIPEFKVYTSDDYNWLGDIFTIKGERYKFCKIAANSLPIYARDAVKISSSLIASLNDGSNNKINGIAPIAYPTSTSITYGLFGIRSAVGTYVNAYHTATASADWDNIPIYYSGTGASANPNGKASVIVLTGLATGTTAQYTSAAWNTILATLDQNQQSRLRGAGVVSAFTGLYNSNYTGYSLPSGANYGITGSTAYPTSGELQVGDLITYNSQTRFVTAVNTGSAEATANINSGFSATATGQTLLIGKMRVKSLLN